MRINTFIDRGDYLALVKSVVQEPGRIMRRLQLLMLWIIVGAVTALIFRLFDFRLGVISAMVTISIFFPIFLYFVARFHKKLLPAKDGNVLGYHSYEIADDGITDNSKHIKSHIKWSGVKYIRETEKHFFVMLDSCMAIIVPKRSLDTESKANEFKILVASKIPGIV